MTNLMLVGENRPFLEVLAMELKLRGSEVRLANDPTALQLALAETTPDLVVLHHVEPMDLYLLNPRIYGYDGPLLVLLETGEPRFVPQQLKAHKVLEKPFLVDTVFAEISLLI